MDCAAKGAAELVDTGSALNPVCIEDIDDAAGPDLCFPGRIVGFDIVPGCRGLRVLVIVELIKVFGAGHFEPDVAAARAPFGGMEYAIVGAARRMIVFNQGDEQ